MQAEEQGDFSTDEFPEGSKINASKNQEDDGWVSERAAFATQRSASLTLNSNSHQNHMLLSFIHIYVVSNAYIINMHNVLSLTCSKRSYCY